MNELDPLPIHRLVLKRLADDRALLLGIFVGILIATTLVAAGPVYFHALERMALDLGLDKLGRTQSNINTFAYNIPITDDELDATQNVFDEALDNHLAPIVEGYERYLMVDTYLAGLPANPLPQSPEPLGQASRAYFRNFTNMYEHVIAIEGRVAGDSVRDKDNGPIVEAVISGITADMFNLSLHEEITLVSDIGAPTGITAIITGIVEPINPYEDYWEPRPGSFLDPLGPEGASIDYPVVFNTDEAPVPLFITRKAMVEAIKRAYPGTLIDSLWFVRLNMEQVKDWSITKFRQRFKNFEQGLESAMPGSEVLSGINSLLDSFEQRSFFSRIPILLLMAIMIVTVLFYVSMMVAHLVHSREDDMALLRTRGGGTFQILRLYTFEGLVMVIISTLVAPILAMAVVSLAGKLHYFHDMTGGDLLPVKIALLPFLAAVGVGLLRLCIFVIPGLIDAKTGLLTRKSRSSRPPTSSFFHRYYIDVALMVVGGLTFWEMYSRGHILSGGLFKDIQINETLLLAPIFFLVLVALVFMRLFPLLVRFISGESAAVLHLVTAATVVFLNGVLLVRFTQGGDMVASLIPMTLALAVGGAYWATTFTQHIKLQITGMALQATIASVFGIIEPLDPGEMLFAPTIFLFALVPAQIIFVLLRWFSRITPVWLAIALAHMARNPLQYTWLVLLLVLVTGLGVLSTTVGGTLDRSQKDQVSYDVAADFRVTDISLALSGGPSSVRDGYFGIPGVNAASVAIREMGGVGSIFFEVLGLEPREFAYMTWYRDDFSARPLSSIMQSLHPPIGTKKIMIPRGATTINISVKPEVVYRNISVWMVIEDVTGTMTRISLGKLDQNMWRTLSAQIPTQLPNPLHLVSIQLFEPGQGPVATPGSVMMDNIYVTVGLNNERILLEGFEGDNHWQHIVTSPLSSDSISIITDETDVNSSALFTFGKETVERVRGFYRSPTGGPLPVVVNTSLFADTNSRLNDLLLININGISVPVVIRDVVHQFPTMGRVPGRFMLADFEGLVAHLNMLSQGRTYFPNEIFLSQAPAAHEVVRDGLKDWLGLIGEVHDRDTQLESVQTDPLTSAGWKSMVLVALGIVIIAAGLSYTTYLLSFASGSRNEMGFLQSVGFSRRQLMSLLGFEHLSMALVGLGLGTWAGFQMSRMVVSSVAVTEGGEEIIPPYILITDWSLMLPTYAILTGIFLAALYVLNRSVNRLNLTSIARGEGQ